MIRGASGELRFWTINGRALYPDGKRSTVAAVLALRDTLVERLDPSPNDRRREARAGRRGRRGARRVPPLYRLSRGYVSAVTVRMANGQSSFIVEMMPVDDLIFGAS